MTAATDTKPEMVETFIALRAVNLGTCVRGSGDFIPEYTEKGAITPHALERLLRMRYIERRTVHIAEMDAWRERWERENAPAPVEGSEAVEGESSEEETPEVEQEPTEPPVIEEETIDDLGAKEVEPPKKKVVTRRRRGSN